MDYLSNLPQEIEQYGLCKTLAVRREVIHIKHILTEIFVRKTIDINQILDEIGMSLFDYMEHITNRIRRVHHFNRNYTQNINQIVKGDRDRFFPTIDLYAGLDILVVLDFDGVVTKNTFHNLYNRIVEENKTVICTANPTVTEEWFRLRNLPLPHKIYACKGRVKKIKQLLELNKKHDYVFYVDNESSYLKTAWVFGIQTYQYTQNKIKYFTRKTQ